MTRGQLAVLLIFLMGASVVVGFLVFVVLALVEGGFS